MSKLCDECETVAHCMTHGCIPKRDFWAGYVPEPVKPAQQALDRMAENARELGLDYEPMQDGGIVTAGGSDPRTQRTWVGLTNNELQPIADEYRILFGSWVEDFARAIEAKLKEKNT